MCVWSKENPGFCLGRIPSREVEDRGTLLSVLFWSASPNKTDCACAAVWMQFRILHAIRTRQASRVYSTRRSLLQYDEGSVSRRTLANYIKHHQWCQLTEKRRMSQTTKMTRQGVRDLNHLKGPSTGIRLPMPPQFEVSCSHPNAAIEYDNQTGCSHCRRCSQYWDFDGKPIN
jgi:hypothetical protein